MICPEGLTGSCWPGGERQGPGVKDTRLLEAGKGKETHPPAELPERSAAPPTPRFQPLGPVPDSRPVERRADTSVVPQTTRLMVSLQQNRKKLTELGERPVLDGRFAEEKN